ncbi:hypothetical protein [Saccharothrix yanglingensis]|uniref:Lipoprotein n=1 Tax=Saccharothrix yanglingensis TaxID=659496 RepID=A0ABU0X5K7_9PSEU|nr:hypothetical protein [Saccharothrix yanglingensis]MDQ2587390.1 hypothetical protein [Saccharothrix yanglingensis]
MEIARLAAGACLVLALAGCADHTGLPAVEPPSEVAAQDSSATSPHTAFGAQRVWANGMAVTVSPPSSLKPSDTSFPKSPRTAVFTLTLVNGTTVPYRTNQLVVRASVNGEQAAEVRDSVQGLGGVAAAVAEVAAGGETVLTVAFAVPEHTVPIRVAVEPNGAGQEPRAVFEGTG